MKNTIITAVVLVAGIVLLAFGFSGKKQETDVSNHRESSLNTNKMQKEIYFAGGCFWGTEHFFKLVNGVVSTEVGYANGIVDKPSYQDVTTGKTGFAETVKVVYDPEVIDLDLLIDLFFKTIDPTSLNRQGNDIGTQYRTGIYFTDKNDQALITEKIKGLAASFNNPIVVENEELKNFFDAETYHQDYLDKNPGGYCHIGQDLFEVARKANRD